MAQEWYSVVGGDFEELEQGDIFASCPVPNAVLPVPVTAQNIDGIEVEVEVELRRAILLSQSCDLVQGQGKPKLNSAVLCTLSTLDEIKGAASHPLNDKSTLSNVQKGFHPAYFLLEEFNAGDNDKSLSVPKSFVLFPDVITLPLAYVREMARQGGQRLRLNSPYREALASRFGQFFGRVAMPEQVALPK